MDIRYSSPEVTELWSPSWTYAAWLAIETRTLVHQRRIGLIDTAETAELEERLFKMAVQDADVDDIRAFEETTKHDVVAFLDWLRTDLEDEGPADGPSRWVHFGLTSSDVVDTTQGMRFRAILPSVLQAMGDVIAELNRLATDTTPVVGRTHGQVAEPMEMRARAWGWLGLFAPAAGDLGRFSSRMAVCKLSGPVGTYAHNPQSVENAVARDLNLRPHGPGATQIASRAPLAAWAAAANNTVQACAKIAHDIRLMGLLGETKFTNEPGQVGSSSMAHKVNPIQHEQVAGMARLAGGYALMLSDIGTWLERDISQSSVERVAVPDLWHVVLHTLGLTRQILRGLRVIFPSQGIPNPAFASWLTLRKIEDGWSVERARSWAVEQTSVHPFDVRFEAKLPQSPTVYMLNFPGPTA